MTIVTVIEHKPSLWQKTKAKAKYYGVITLGAFSAFSATNAHAALDVAPLVQEIKSNEASVQTAMLGVLSLVVFLVAYNLLRRILR